MKPFLDSKQSIVEPLSSPVRLFAFFTRADFAGWSARNESTVKSFPTDMSSLCIEVHNFAGPFAFAIKVGFIDDG